MPLPQHDGRFHADNSVDNRQLAAGIDPAKLSPGVDGQLLKTVDGEVVWGDSTAGVEDLDDLGDVAIASPTSGQVLRHNGTSFVNASLQAGDLPAGIDVAKLGSGNVSNAELGYLDGVASSIQTQLDGKAASSHTHSASAITSGVLDAARLPSGIDAALIGSGGVSTTEFGYLDGVTSSVQTQLNAKQASVLAIQEEPSGVKDGVNTTFTLTGAPSWGVLIIEGVSLRWGVDFSVSGSTVTVTAAAPQSGDDMWFVGLAV